MGQVFISYSSADRGWAEVLEDKLKPHLDVYRDKTRLTAGRPYQESLYSALEKSSALVIIWSKRVRDMQGEWKEWVITERAQFQAYHPDAPVVYMLLDDEVPKVDAHTHKLDDLVGKNAQKVGEAVWPELIRKIKLAVLPNRIEIACYVLACTNAEFQTLSGDPNVDAVLRSLGFAFDEVATCYGAAREDWHLTPALPIRTLLAELEPALTTVLRENGVPQPFSGNEVLIQIQSGLTGLWDALDPEVRKEADRLANLDFLWVFVDPLSLYHSKVEKVAHRLIGCRERNPWVNLFILDPIGRLHDRSDLRQKLVTDFSPLYSPLVKPKFPDGSRCLGGVDLWHADDFERAFRETVRLRGLSRREQQPRRGPHRAWTSFGA